MRLLLDTHTFVWWSNEYQKLPVSLREAFNDSQHTIYLSLASIWELQIKTQLGKLHLGAPLKHIIREQQARNNFLFLPISESHIYALGNLPHHHKDPFDRLLVAQAKTEDLTLVTHDSRISDYEVKIIWDI